MGFPLVKVGGRTHAEACEQTGWARHVFFDTGDGQCFAVWDLHDGHLPPTSIPRSAAASASRRGSTTSRSTRPSLDELAARGDRWIDHGQDVIEIDHGWCTSIYAKDPNGTRWSSAAPPATFTPPTSTGARSSTRHRPLDDAPGTTFYVPEESRRRRRRGRETWRGARASVGRRPTEKGGGATVSPHHPGNRRWRAPDPWAVRWTTNPSGPSSTASTPGSSPPWRWCAAACATAEDSVQEALARAWERPDRGDGDRPARGVGHDRRAQPGPEPDAALAARNDGRGPGSGPLPTTSRTARRRAATPAGPGGARRAPAPPTRGDGAAVLPRARRPRDRRAPRHRRGHVKAMLFRARQSLAAHWLHGRRPAGEPEEVHRARG